MPKSQPHNLLRKITAEHILLVALLIVSGYMFIESYEFREPSGMFPRFTAAVTIIGALLLLFKNYLPGPLRAFVSESGDLFDSYEEEIEGVEGKSEDTTSTAADESSADAHGDIPDRDSSTEATTGMAADPGSEERSGLPSLREALENKRFVLAVMTIGYVVLCYLIGFLFASPLFVFAYSYWVRHEWYITAGLTAGSFGIVYSFMELLNVQLDSGILVI